MREDLVYASGHLRKPMSSATVPCKFRGPGIECPREEFMTEKCNTCGWNPTVEAERIARLKRNG